jgi:hypothetical protein
MRALTDPAPVDARDPGDPGRRIWAFSGLITAAAMVVVTALLIAPAPDSAQDGSAQPQGAQALAIPAQAEATTTQTVTFPQPVTSLTVLSYGAPVQITGGTAGGVQVIEAISYNGSPPPVTQSVDRGHLLLADPMCSVPRLYAACSVSFTVIVPAGVAVAVDTGGGPARLTFAEPPASVSVSTGGGPATVDVPGGPYALIANSGGGQEIIAIATDPSAGRSVTISTNGGPLQVGP